MRILITNDDGVVSKATRQLAVELHRLGHIVSVWCPAHNMSGYGSAISLSKNIVVKKDNSEPIPIYAVNGTTSDAVIIGLKYEHEIGNNIDMVISGINLGSNLGSDTIASSTVAGAITSIVKGVPSMAVSIASSRPRYLTTTVSFFVSSLFPVLSSVVTTHYFLNINIADKKEIKGVKVVPLSKFGWERQYKFQEDSDNIYGHIGATSPNKIRLVKENTDIYWFRRGYVTITPVTEHFVYMNIVQLIKEKLSFL